MRGFSKRKFLEIPQFWLWVEFSGICLGIGIFISGDIEKSGNSKYQESGNLIPEIGTFSAIRLAPFN